MSDPVDNEENSSAPASSKGDQAAKPGIFVLLLMAMMGMMGGAAGAGGVCLYLQHSGLLGGAAQIAPATTTIAKPDVHAAVKPVAAHALTLDPFLVNLADPAGKSYLKLSLILRIADPPESKDKPAKEEKDAKSKDAADGPLGEERAESRDTILEVLSRQQSETLLAADGKEKLKQVLKDALHQHNPQMTVLEIYFTDFLVQR